MAKPLPKVVRNRKPGDILHFRDHPEFQPNVHPKEMFAMGIFRHVGGYYRPIHSHVTGKNYANEWREIPYFAKMNSRLFDDAGNAQPQLNYFGVASGTSLEDWENKNWIVAQDPYGWIQWYCRFVAGRRSPDDERQIKRWIKTGGPNSRFRVRLLNMIVKNKTHMDDVSVSPTIRQTLLNWGVIVI